MGKIPAGSRLTQAQADRFISTNGAAVTHSIWKDKINTEEG